MSDDERLEKEPSLPSAIEKKERLFFGSLELQEKERLERGESPEPMNEEDVSSSDSEIDAMEFENAFQESEQSEAAKAKREALLRQLAMEKQSRTLLVPTDIDEVKGLLRRIGHPITLFGEGAPERRDRLRKLLSELDAAGKDVDKLVQTYRPPEPAREEVQEELFYTEGIPELQAARLDIAWFSLKRASERVKKERELYAHGNTRDRLVEYQTLFDRVRKTAIVSSQVGDDRPLCVCAFAPDSKHILTSSMGGLVKLWSVPDCANTMSFRGHYERVTGLGFHPESFKSLSPSAVNFASCGVDNSARLWSLDSTSSLATLQGHTDRLCKVAFHPSGKYVGTTSFDTTWRLWDVETKQELLTQEGHSRGTYGIAFQCDGSLVATTDIGGIARVWDLRSGKSIMSLEGHVKQIVAVDFSPVGFQLATGSDDNTARVWDLRQKACMYTIPAHSGMISAVKFEPEHGRYLMTASYDNSVKVWSTLGWYMVKALAGHESKIMGADISPDGKYIASAAYDRTWKLWSSE